ncbi:MAG: hypothetical protein JJU27_02800 [Gammaproteobacteria bacterium]|nr:hypothetical protein [Gammaproteobacteria bacterium]MCC5867416.1 hypothetical protein [Gammaproteobacteria bacterium]
MNPIAGKMPLFYRHRGWWEGEYVHCSPGMEIEDRYLFRIHAEFPDAGRPAYRQTSHYWWPDGREAQLSYEAELKGDRVVFDDGRIAGALWPIDDVTLYLRFGYHGQEDGYICEMLQLSPDGQHRARTWHWFEQHRLSRITLVNERRGEAMDAPWDSPPEAPAKTNTYRHPAGQARTHRRSFRD